MTPPSSPPVPPDPTCPVCSKPVRSGGFILTERGGAVHIRCHSQELRLSAIEQGDRARVAIARASSLVERTRASQLRVTRSLTPQHDRCPLCDGPATLTDWRPHLDWTTVEDCPCRGFFLWTPLRVEGRLGRLTQEDRDTLKERLRDLRAAGIEAWLTTRDHTVMGALLIRTERPDRPH